jgi:hypothetical protein
MAAGAGACHFCFVDSTLVICLLTALLSGCAQPAVPPTRVLFVGNSFTYVNDLPHLFATLAEAGHHPVVVDMVAPSGWTLAQHAASPETRAKITGSPWNYVVLQEQSLMPAVPAARTGYMYPAVRALVQLIRARGSEPVLFLTWGRRDGSDEAGYADFHTMQAALTTGYLSIADELDLRVAPAGAAWQLAVAQHPSVPLWDADGSHPALAGSYLTACVLYATLFHVSPEGLPAPEGIAGDFARRLQGLAGQAVFNEAARWHLH